jgi:beta-phosphoglucomutase-like phosphatase (HAD superfamily)
LLACRCRVASLRTVVSTGSTNVSRSHACCRFCDPHVFSASQVAYGKPAPDLFLFAAQRLGAAPEDCIVVEDSIPGVEAAVAAGMPVVGFCGGGHCPDGHADRLIAAGCSRVFAKMPDLAAFLREERCG